MYLERGWVEKPDIVECNIKKLLRNFEGSNGSIFKKLWGLKVEEVSYKKRVYQNFTGCMVLMARIYGPDLWSGFMARIYGPDSWSFVVRIHGPDLAG